MMHRRCATVRSFAVWARVGWTRPAVSLALLLVSLLHLGQANPQPASSVPAARQATHLAVITVKGGIDVDPPGTTIMANSFARRIRLAERAGADAIVVE